MKFQSYNVVVRHYDEDERTDFCTKSISFYDEDGDQHCLDGPAYQMFDFEGKLLREEYWINGFPFSKEDFLKKTSKESSKNKIVEMDGKRFKLVPVD